MRHVRSMLVRGTTLFATAALVGGNGGCDKVPTFQELTQQAQPAPAASATPQEAVKPNPAQPPAATGTASVEPQPEDPQKVIEEFNKKSSTARNDSDLMRLSSLPAGLEQFREMDLKQSPVTDQGLPHLAKLTNLESVNLSNTKITDAGLSVTLNLPKLTRLDLSACTVTPAMMASLSKLENLEVLSLEGTRIGDEDVSQLANLAQLKELNLSHTMITDSSFRVLGTLKSLEILKVSNTNLNGSGMQFMKSKRAEGGLRVLDASRTHFGEQGLQHLKGAEALEELNVAAAGVTDRALAQHLKGVSHLKKLILSFNTISNAGVPALASIKSLEELYLCECYKMDDQSLFLLKSNKELKVLDVSGCGNVSTKGGQALKKFLPDCEIRFGTTKL